MLVNYNLQLIFIYKLTGVGNISCVTSPRQLLKQDTKLTKAIVATLECLPLPLNENWMQIADIIATTINPLN